MKPNKILQKSIVFEKKTLPLQSIWRFRSSVGLEQQPSKLWVLGSNPNGITKRNNFKSKKERILLSVKSSFGYLTNLLYLCNGLSQCT